MQINSVLNFNRTYLDSLVQDEQSLVILTPNSKQRIAIQPYQFNDVCSAIRNILNESIGTYSKRLQGFVFGYKNLRLLNNVGYTFNDSSSLHIDVEACFYIFQFSIKSHLKAVVNKVSSDHVGCLVYNAFNVSVPKYIENTDGDILWPDDLQIGSEVIVEVSHTNFEGRLPFIKGKLISIVQDHIKLEASSNCSDLEMHSTEWTPLGRKSKKRKTRINDNLAIKRRKKNKKKKNKSSIIT